MSDDAAPSSRATIKEVYDLIGELRKEVFAAMADLDNKQEARFGVLLTSLESAVASIRGDFVPEKLCVERHDAHDAALQAAVSKSEDDRQKLWGRVHELEAGLKQAAALVVTAFLGLIVYLIQQHFG